MTDPGTASGGTVGTITLKLPPFWPADLDIWFAQVEAQFTTRGITVEKTKFDYIIASLSPETATEVRDIILAPPTDLPYTTLKKELIKRTAGSNQCKLQKLLNEVELGDRKPSQLLRRMRQLWSDRPDDAFLRELFLQRLPNNVRVVLAPLGIDVSLDKLADTADRIVEVATPSIAAFHAPPTGTSSQSAELASLRAEVTRLQDQMKSLSLQPRLPRRRSLTPARRRSPSPYQQRASRDHTLCWYHQRFGDAATKCNQPCSKGLNGQARC